ncbi:hypothetical protein BBK14_33885 [Parafrankia soli]|uniref:Uncharacterized protein n=1 Tax=Parafrankia soli TaxID=2599596 RepID=A0A1S1QE61_9ACTN|nr:hypothetical protein [Parafrankia soli]OHV31505.1 hypothetical protein BBK14_33885 [Parafrankia soli]
MIDPPELDTVAEAFQPDVPRHRAEGAAQDVIAAADRQGRALGDDEVENLIACRVPMLAAREVAPRVAAALRKSRGGV